jgi:hypothetical protein
MREAIVPLVLSLLVGCGGASVGTATSPHPGARLHLAPTTDLAQAAAIAWLIDVKPRELAARAELLPAIDTLLPHDRVAAFTERNGFDPLALDELTLASYSSAEGETTLYLARGALAPAKLEAIFRARTGGVEGRGIDRQGEQEIVRTWGTSGRGRAQMATFGREAAALEIGRFGPLRVAELFAQERLKRASPALRTGALARAAELVRDPPPGGVQAEAGRAGEASEDGDAPLRGFTLGPFEGESAKGLGGLLAASTAAAVAARPTTMGDHAALRITLVLTGGWGADAPKAADRLAAAFDALSATGLGRLAGLDHPLDIVHVEPLPDALRLTVALDALGLARGARAAMGAEVSEIMSY